MIFSIGLVLFLLGWGYVKLRDWCTGRDTMYRASVYGDATSLLCVIAGLVLMCISLVILAWRFLPHVWKVLP